jgi:hypothetical protein
MLILEVFFGSLCVFSLNLGNVVGGLGVIGTLATLELTDVCGHFPLFVRFVWQLHLMQDTWVSF